MNKTTRHQFINTNPVQILLIVFVFLYSFYNVLFNVKPYPSGYCAEYVLTTEAIVNHGSTDIRSQDFESFKTNYALNDTWDNTDTSEFFDGYSTFFKQDTLAFGDYYKGIYTATNGLHYASHSTTLAYLNTPMLLLIKALGQNPIYSIPLTNVLCIILVLALLLLIGNYSLLTHCITALSFLCSAIMWYSGWLGAEVFVMCGVTAGLWLYLHSYRYWGLVSIAIVSTQALPLIIILIVLCVHNLYVTKFNKKTIGVISLLLLLTALPWIIYYTHFNTLNVLAYTNYSTWELVSAGRVFSLLFDLNQGIIITIPLVLVFYIVLWAKSTIDFLRKKSTEPFHVIFPIAVLVLMVIISTSADWNQPQHVINSYATYPSLLILTHCLYWLNNLQISTVAKTVLQVVLLASQAATTLNHSVKEKGAWGDGNKFKPMAEWAMYNCNDWYNPDPEIFIERLPNNSTQQNIATYVNANGEVYKIAINTNDLNSLKLIGLNDVQISNITPCIVKAGYQFTTFNNTTATHTLYTNWGYINRKDIVTHLDSGTIATIEARYVMIKYINEIQQLIIGMRNDSVIYAQIVEKAKLRNAAVEGVLVADAIWILQPPAKAISAQQLIDKLINTPEIYSEIVQKSQERKAPAGDVVIADTKYILGLPPQ